MAIAMLLMAVPVTASDGIAETDRAIGEHDPEHGDGLLLPSLLPLEEPLVDLSKYVGVAVSRTRTDGTSVGAVLVIDQEGRGVNEAQMREAGLPVITLPQIEETSQEQLEEMAIPFAQVDAELDRIAGDNQMGVLSHPPPGISHTTSLPVTLYADRKLQEQSGWSTDVVSAFDATDSIMTNAKVAIHQFFLMQSGVPVHDASTRCHVQGAAVHEEGYEPHVGVFIAVFSPGDINIGSGTAWGIALNGPVTYQIRYSSEISSKIHCSPGDPGYKRAGNKDDGTFIPSVYVKHNPFGVHTYMKHLTAHEFAHQFTMRHSDAWCEWSWLAGHEHQSIETFTSDGVSGCLQDPGPIHHHWTFSGTTKTRMETERRAWTNCYNNQAC